MPTYAFTGLVPPAFGETIELMLSEANARLGEIEGVRGRAVYGLAGEELAAFGDAWTCWWSARAATARSSGWCSAAPPTTSSATHAVRC